MRDPSSLLGAREEERRWKGLDAGLVVEPQLLFVRQVVVC